MLYGYKSRCFSADNSSIKCRKSDNSVHLRGHEIPAMTRSRFTEDQINDEGRAERPPRKKVVTPAAKPQAIAHLVAHRAMSERRTCRVIGCCRMTMRKEVSARMPLCCGND